MPELNLNDGERVLLWTLAAVIAVLVAVMWLSAPMGAERFTQPPGQQLVPDGAVDPNGPGASCWSFT